MNKLAQELAARTYTECTVTDRTAMGERCYVAYSPEVTFCMGQGTTPDEAIADLRRARVDLFQSLLDDGLPVPEPKAFSNEVIAVNLNSPWQHWTVTL